jgi:hypothetical protein
LTWSAQSVLQRSSDETSRVQLLTIERSLKPALLLRHDAKTALVALLLPGIKLCQVDCIRHDCIMKTILTHSYRQLTLTVKTLTASPGALRGSDFELNSDSRPASSKGQQAESTQVAGMHCACARTDSVSKGLVSQAAAGHVSL